MKCPTCKVGEVYYKQSAIITYNLLDNGDINKELEVCGGDDSWLECSHCNCNETSNDEYKAIFSRDFDTSMSEAE